LVGVHEVKIALTIVVCGFIVHVHKIYVLLAMLLPIHKVILLILLILLAFFIRSHKTLHFPKK